MKYNKFEIAYARMEKVLTSVRGKAFLEYVRGKRGLNGEACLYPLAEVVQKFKDPMEIIRHLNTGVMKRVQDGMRQKLAPTPSRCHLGQRRHQYGITFEEPTVIEYLDAGFTRRPLGQLMEKSGETLVLLHFPVSPLKPAQQTFIQRPLFLRSKRQAVSRPRRRIQVTSEDLQESQIR
jgi:hypothetical protein